MAQVEVISALLSYSVGPTKPAGTRRPDLNMLLDITDLETRGLIPVCCVGRHEMDLVCVCKWTQLQLQSAAAAILLFDK